MARPWYPRATAWYVFLATVSFWGAECAPAPATSVELPLQELSALGQLRSSVNLTFAQVEQLRWTEPTPCIGNCGINQCYWGGIACSGGHVVQIDLSDSVVSSTPTLMAGQLTPALSQLTQLAFLNMSGHKFSGPLPGAWGSLTSLQTLDLSYNSLTGTLPSQWGNLSALATMNLSTNQLTGPIPLTWTRLPLLQTADLRANNICTDNATFASSTVVLDTPVGNCSQAQIYASLAPLGGPLAAQNASPSATATPTPTPAVFSTPNNAPILQMSTGINIAVSVVIGAFLLFGIIAGIFRVKRQQRAHQRWITGRMVELRQREAQEEANFKELLQKIVPPSIMLDPEGQELWLCQPDYPVADVQGKQMGDAEWEAVGGGSTATPDSISDSTPSGSAAVNDQSSALHTSTAANAGGSGDLGEDGSSGPSRVATEQWQANPAANQMPPLREQYRYITEYHRRQRMGLRHKKVPLFTVDVFISDKGSLTFHPCSEPPLDCLRPALESRDADFEKRSSPESAKDQQSAAAQARGGVTSDPRRSVEMSAMGRQSSFRVERSANSTISTNEVEARRRDGIDGLRDPAQSNEMATPPPPQAFISSAAIRGFLGLESLEARHARFRAEAEQRLREEEAAEQGGSQDARPHR